MLAHGLRRDAPQLSFDVQLYTSSLCELVLVVDRRHGEWKLFLSLFRVLQRDTSCV